MKFIIGSTFKSTTFPGYILTIKKADTSFHFDSVKSNCALSSVYSIEEAEANFVNGIFYDYKTPSTKDPLCITSTEKSLLQTALQALRSTCLFAMILLCLMAIFFSCCTPVHYVYTPSAVRIEGKTYVRFQRSEFIVRKGDTIILQKKKI